MKRALIVCAMLLIPSIATAGKQNLTIWADASFDQPGQPLGWMMISSEPPVMYNGFAVDALQIVPMNKRASRALSSLSGGHTYTCTGEAFLFSPYQWLIGVSSLDAKSCVQAD